MGGVDRRYMYQYHHVPSRSLTARPWKVTVSPNRKGSSSFQPPFFIILQGPGDSLTRPYIQLIEVSTSILGTWIFWWEDICNRFLDGKVFSHWSPEWPLKVLRIRRSRRFRCGAVKRSRFCHQCDCRLDLLTPHPLTVANNGLLMFIIGISY